MTGAEWAILVVGIVTAGATSVTAYAVWNQWRGSIQVEWGFAWRDMYERSIPPTLEVVVTVRNYRNFGIVANRAEVPRVPVNDLNRAGIAGGSNS